MEYYCHGTENEWWWLRLSRHGSHPEADQVQENTTWGKKQFSQLNQHEYCWNRSVSLGALPHLAFQCNLCKKRESSHKNVLKVGRSSQLSHSLRQHRAVLREEQH